METPLLAVGLVHDLHLYFPPVAWSHDPHAPQDPQLPLTCPEIQVRHNIYRHCALWVPFPSLLIDKTKVDWARVSSGPPAAKNMKFNNEIGSKFMLQSQHSEARYCVRCWLFTFIIYIIKISCFDINVNKLFMERHASPWQTQETACLRKHM